MSHEYYKTHAPASYVEKAQKVTASLIPSIVINIAVDTQYLIGQPSNSNYAGQGIYMMDNNVLAGSTNEGSLELDTFCVSGQIIGFNVFPIDSLQGLGDTVEISAFQVSKDSPNLWAGGAPQMQSSGEYQWIGQIIGSNQKMTYQIMISVNSGGVAPIKRTFYWDPYITCQ